jgi:hypothetical protein
MAKHHKLRQFCATVVLLATGITGQILPDEARNAVTMWLLRDCDVNESTDIENVLRKYNAQLEPMFLTALRDGPDAPLLNAVQVSATRRFLIRQESLKTGSGLGLSEEDLADARKVTREQYVEQQKQDFVLRYKSQAIAGLGIMGGTAAKSALERIASDPASDLYGSAKIALRQIPKRKAPPK